MRYILMTYVGPEHLDAWNAMTTEERQGDVDRTMAWFRENANRIVGGEELGYPRNPQRGRVSPGRATRSRSARSATRRPR